VCCVQFELRCQDWLDHNREQEQIKPEDHDNWKPEGHDNWKPQTSSNSSATVDLDGMDDLDVAIAVGGLGSAVFVCCCLLVCCCRRCRAGRASAGAKVRDGRAKGLEGVGFGEERGPDPEHALRDGNEEGDLLMLLDDLERMEPGLAKGEPTPDPTLRAEAEHEVERIISARGAKDIFGGGSLDQQKSEFRRLVRMLHPDKQLVAGPRATLALRLVVEASRTLVPTR